MHKTKRVTNKRRSLKRKQRGGVKRKQTLDDGSVIEGDFHKGKVKGVGMLTCLDGSVYTGKFDGNIPHDPKGVLTFSNGSRYEGSFVNGIFMNGVLTHPNGDIYEGTFVDNNGMQVANGSGGRYRWQNGDSYVGDFILGRMHGRGILTRNDFVFDGEFKDGMVNGRGHLIWPDGTVEEGNFMTINGEIVNLDMPPLEPIPGIVGADKAMIRYKAERAIAERPSAKPQ